MEVLDVPAGTDLGVLATHRPAGPGRPAAVVVHRRPVLARAPEGGALVDLVRDLVAEEIAALLAVEPEDLDPGYGRT